MITLILKVLGGIVSLVLLSFVAVIFVLQMLFGG